MIRGYSAPWEIGTDFAMAEPEAANWPVAAGFRDSAMTNNPAIGFDGPAGDRVMRERRYQVARDHAHKLRWDTLFIAGAGHVLPLHCRAARA